MMREVMFSCHSCIHYFGKWQVRLLYSHSLFSHLHLEPVIHISSPPATAFPSALQCRCVSHTEAGNFHWRCLWKGNIGREAGMAWKRWSQRWKGTEVPLNTVYAILPGMIKKKKFMHSEKPWAIECEKEKAYGMATLDLWGLSMNVMFLASSTKQLYKASAPPNKCFDVFEEPLWYKRVAFLVLHGIELGGAEPCWSMFFWCIIAHTLINGTVSNLNWQQQLIITFAFGASVLSVLGRKVNGLCGKKMRSIISRNNLPCWNKCKN